MKIAVLLLAAAILAASVILRSWEGVQVDVDLDPCLHICGDVTAIQMKQDSSSGVDRDNP